LAVICGGQATAQIALQGPMATVSNQPDRVFLLAGQPPAITPTTPVEYWAWTLFKTPQANGANALAVRYRFDCAAGTVATAYVEAYGAAGLMAGQAAPAAMQSPRAGSVDEALKQVICEPQENALTERFATIDIARFTLTQTEGR
jgi:hypothetical protein